MCLALRQNIFFSLNRRWAKEVVAVKAAGSIGGTTKVMMSREFNITSLAVAYVIE